MSKKTRQELLRDSINLDIKDLTSAEFVALLSPEFDVLRDFFKQMEHHDDFLKTHGLFRARVMLAVIDGLESQHTKRGTKAGRPRLPEIVVKEMLDASSYTHFETKLKGMGYDKKDIPDESTYYDYRRKAKKKNSE